MKLKVLRRLKKLVSEIEKVKENINNQRKKAQDVLLMIVNYKKQTKRLIS